MVDMVAVDITAVLSDVIDDDSQPRRQRLATQWRDRAGRADPL